MSKYLKLYDELIVGRIQNPIEQIKGSELHHIKPASMCRFSDRFGERDDYVWNINADDESNLVRMYPNEHLKAHYYLWKHYRAPQMAAALRLMLSINITDDNLDMSANEYEQLRGDAVPSMVRGAMTNYAALCAAGKESTKRRVSDGTHNFIGVMPWDNVRVKKNPDSMAAWENMHTIHHIWSSNGECTYRKLRHLVNESLCIDCRLEGMVNIFKNPDRFHAVKVGWESKYNS